MQTLSFKIIFAILNVWFGFYHRFKLLSFLYILAQYAVLEANAKVNGRG